MVWSDRCPTVTRVVGFSQKVLGRTGAVAILVQLVARGYHHVILRNGSSTDRLQIVHRLLCPARASEALIFQVWIGQP